ncbi:hypothetical protein GPJ56_006744 [Histomonas meleagridis]|uniref:uncharacterized protein n=1 Tax=Histomonas meleagridis TaxID=135588 RepID=UPI003559765A|nr:hypothetical protein GPJ56_006744 [Histomonas meleagridis]KAH0806960.1 hypothetical protein GO595_000136 [Histomonas meleagridis]
MESKEQKRLYDAGMHIIQLAIKARIEGNQKLAEQYATNFLVLCQSIESNMKEASKLPQDHVMESLEKLNEGRVALSKQLSIAKEQKNAKSTKEIQAALNTVTAHCKVMNLCLTQGFMPPKIVQSQFKYLSPVVQNIPEEDIVVTIKNLETTDPNENNSYSFIAYSPTDTDKQCPTTTERFTPGKVSFPISFNCIRRNHPNFVERFLRKSVKLELICFTKHLFKISEAKVATLDIPVALLESQSKVQKDFIMDPVANSKHNTQYSITIEIKANTSLKTPEYKVCEIDYYTIAKDAQIQKPTLKVTPREVSQLTPEEKKQLSSKLVPCRLLEPWELERFICLQALRHIKESTSKNIEAFKSFNVVYPPKMEEQLKTVEKRLIELENSIKTSKISVQDYINMVKKQILSDAQEIKRRGKDTLEGKALFERLQLMMKERDSLIKK